MMTEVEHMMSLFLCLLHNDMTKNMSLPYVVIHTIIYLGDNLKMTGNCKGRLLLWTSQYMGCECTIHKTHFGV